MAPPGKHRDTLLAAAARLFRTQGYAATGLAEILQDSGAPKGSLYHYFPGGKAQIGAAAVEHAGAMVTRTLEGLADDGASPDALFRNYANALAGWMARSHWRAGCPIATTLLETAPVDEAITLAGVQAFEAWTGVLVRALVADGVSPERAFSLARFGIMAIEGALLLARIEQSAAPIHAAAQEVADLIARARPSRDGQGGPEGPACEPQARID